MILARHHSNLTVVRDTHPKLLHDWTELSATRFVTDERGQSLPLRFELHHFAVKVRDLSRLRNSVASTPDHSRSDEHKANE
jgi:hypothetical protein